MIKANELRIGEYVYDCSHEGLKKLSIVQNGTKEFITLKNVETGNSYTVSEVHIEAIPLTPVLMEKLGFNKVGPRGVWQYINLNSWEGNFFLEGLIGPDNTFYVSYTNERSNVPFNRTRTIFYLHTLQRIYDAVRGYSIPSENIKRAILR